jgi:death-on-curing protein
MNFRFLSVEEVLYIHQSETKLAGHNSDLRDFKLIESAVENTRQIFENDYVTDLFDLAVSYIRSITMNHPFIDGNKRTALATALIFIDYNGFIIIENSEEELANKIIEFVEKKISSDELSNYLRSKAIKNT